MVDIPKMAEIGAFLRSDNVPGATSSIEKGRINASGPDAPDLELINCDCFSDNDLSQS